MGSGRIVLLVSGFSLFFYNLLCYSSAHLSFVGRKGLGECCCLTVSFVPVFSFCCFSVWVRKRWVLVQSLVSLLRGCYASNYVRSLGDVASHVCKRHRGMDGVSFYLATHTLLDPMFTTITDGLSV